MTHVEGHQVKFYNRNNSAKNCSIAFKFDTEFYRVTGDTYANVQGKRSKVVITGSKVKFIA